MLESRQRHFLIAATLLLSPFLLLLDPPAALAAGCVATAVGPIGITVGVPPSLFAAEKLDIEVGPVFATGDNREDEVTR